MTEDKTIKIQLDPDYINSPRHNNSLDEFRREYDQGAPTSIALRILGLTQKEFDIIHDCVIIKLQEAMGGNDDN